MNRMPVQASDLLRSFRFYHDETGIEGLIESFDLQDVTPVQLYRAVHGRPPDTIDEAMSDNRHPIANIFAAFLRSGEFRSKLVRNVLAAWPDKRRLLFVHIPKCAGSNLSSHLITRYASLNTNVLEEELTDQATFFRAVKNVMLEAYASDAIYVHGHVHLNTYEEWGALRNGDQVFTVLRDPADLIVSQVNYTLTRMLSDEQPIPADTSGWRREFGFEPDTKPCVTDLKSLALRILSHRGVVPENVMCHFLGNGTAQSATARIVTRDVEVTTMPRYGAWCRERWGITESTRKNPSNQYFKLADFSAVDQDLIAEITMEDRTLYHWAETRLAASSAHSLVGRHFLTVPMPGAANVSGEGGRPVSPGADHGPELPLAELVMRFESLGENCEFGLVQRRCGAEPLGLLRFASAPLDKLLKALRSRFEGMGQPENIDVQLSSNGREYMVLDRCYGFFYHAWVLKDEQTREQVAAREARRVPFLIRKLIEDLALGEKIFVYHGMTPLSVGQARELMAAVRSYGPGLLLWVEVMDATHPAGLIEDWGDGLMKAYIDRFAPGENAHDFSVEGWADLCRRSLNVASMLKAKDTV